MNLWLPVLLGSLGTYIEKIAGYLVPASWLENQRLRNVIEPMPIGLLAALIGYQTFGSGTALTVDGRLVGLLVAAIALRMKQTFIVVVLAAAIATAAGRALGWLG